MISCMWAILCSAVGINCSAFQQLAARVVCFDCFVASLFTDFWFWNAVECFEVQNLTAQWCTAINEPQKPHWNERNSSKLLIDTSANFQSALGSFFNFHCIQIAQFITCTQSQSFAAGDVFSVRQCRGKTWIIHPSRRFYLSRKYPAYSPRLI